MGKMLGGTFPRRRPAGYARFAVVAVILLFVIYSFSGDSGDALPPGTAFTRPDGDAPSNSKPYTGGSKEKLPTYGSPYDSTADDAAKGSSKGSTGGSTGGSTYGDHKETSSSYGSGEPSGSSPYDSSKGSSGSSYGSVGESKGSSGSVSGSGSDSSTTSPHGSEKGSSSSSTGTTNSGPEDSHPIDKLIYDAQHTFAELQSKESKTLQEAAQAYRKRRGRHPPPGFEEWYEFARSQNALIVEDFFDQVYHDLEPFWGMPPSVLRKESWDFEMTINIRDGKATAGSDWFWTQIWLNLIKTVEHLLPDMDLALNAMDEPRLVVPFEDISSYMTKAKKTINLPKASAMSSTNQKLPTPGQGDLNVQTRDKSFEDTRPFWNIARRGCNPSSLAQTSPLHGKVGNPPSIDMSFADPHSYRGFVSNFTLSSDFCHQPDLQSLEGIFIEPLSVSSSKVMFPMFGGSKLSVNNEILLPAPMYWNEEERFTGGNDHGIAWGEKADRVIWRGVATGGKNRADNWRGFQRHRFVAMNNGSAVSLAESGKSHAENFVLPETQYGITHEVGDWVETFSDVAFTDLMCDPPQEDGSCPHTNAYFERANGISMAQQFDNKFLPDIDGNSFSGRYLGFLRSTSLPVKATIWREWHDSRLVAWKHFVPMDSRFGDYYGIMDYFLGHNGKGGHDKAAEKIAMEGKEWAEKVLRKEDMQVYVLRLLLEYARVLDDDREKLGWVDDALKNPNIEATWARW